MTLSSAEKSRRYRVRHPELAKESYRKHNAKRRPNPERNRGYGQKWRDSQKKKGLKRKRPCLTCPDQMKKSLETLRVWSADNMEALLLQSIKRRAKKAGIAFNLKATDVGKIPKVCPVFGIPLIRGKKHSGPNSPTLDRVNPSKGYTKGNVAWISNLANGMKSNANASQHRRIADWMDEFAVKSTLA